MELSSIGFAYARGWSNDSSGRARARAHARIPAHAASAANAAAAGARVASTSPIHHRQHKPPFQKTNDHTKQNSYKNYGLTALFKTSTDKVEVTSTVDNVAPGLKAAIHATLPDTQSAKLLVDYAHQHAHLRTTVGLNTQPKVSVAATTGRGNVIYGAEGTFDTAKSEVTGYGVLVGWTAPDSQLVLQLTGEFERERE